jgi:sorbitol-specific phosphotransferase system component IIC
VAVANYVGDHQFHFSMLLLMQTPVTLLWRGTVLLLIFSINIVGSMTLQRLKEKFLSNTQRPSHYRAAQRDLSFMASLSRSFKAAHLFVY